MNDDLVDALLWGAIQHATVALADGGVSFIITEELCLFIENEALNKIGSGEAELIYGEEEKSTSKILLEEEDKQRLLDLIH